eukprot:Em0009g850a
MATMKTIASLMLVIGLCVLSNGMPNAIKEVAERDIAKDVSNLVSSLGQTAPVTGPPKTELMQAGKNDDLPIGARILEELHTVDDKNVPVTGPPITAMESEDNDMSSDALIQKDEVVFYQMTCAVKTKIKLVHALASQAATTTAKPLSGDGLQRCPVTFDQDGLPRKFHGNV